MPGVLLLWQEDEGTGVQLMDATRLYSRAARVKTALAGAVLAAGTLALPAVAQNEPLPEPAGDVLLTVTGNIARTNNGDVAEFDRAMLEALPDATLETSTVVTDGVNTFTGFYMTDLLDLVGAEGDTVTASALNDYVIDIPMTDFERFDVVVASQMDGERLLPRNKGPYWIVYPRDDHDELQDIRYDYRWVWQLIRLDVK